MSDLVDLLPVNGGAPGTALLRKPAWIRTKSTLTPAVADTRRLLQKLQLPTVCQEAACPNLGECWSKKHATIMIMGDVCTRACAFCNVKTGLPRLLDASEPERVATACARLGLRHIVITSVDRDDLPGAPLSASGDRLDERPGKPARRRCP